MAIFDILGGGIVTWILIFLAVVVLSFFFKSFLLPFLGIKKSMGDESSKTKGLLSNLLSKNIEDKKRERSEEVKEGEAGKHLGEANDVTKTIKGQLDQVASSKDFNPTRVVAVKSELNSIRGLLTKEAQEYHNLLQEYSADANLEKGEFSDLKGILKNEGKLADNDNKIIKSLTEYNQNNPHLLEVLSFTEQLIPLVKNIKKTLEFQLNLARILKTTSESRVAKIRLIFNLIDICEQNLSSKAPLTRISELESNLEKIQTSLTELNVLNQNAKNQMQRKSELADKRDSDLKLMLDLAERRDQSLKAAEAELAQLANQGAIDKEILQTD